MKHSITTRQYLFGFILITSLFFMWGLSMGLLDVLNKHFQETLDVSKAQSGFLQMAYFGAYFIVALPAGLFITKMGYKAGIIVGLSLFAVGALLFVPASYVLTYPFFLFALFVLALGLGFLETAANPYSTALGAPETAEARLNLSQSFNGLGQFAGPVIGGAFFFSETDSIEASHGAVTITYVVVAAVVILLIILFAKARLPDLRDREEALDAANLGQHQRSIWSHKEFTFGVVSQFFYVAAQVGVSAFFLNLTTETWDGMTSQRAAFLLSIGLLMFMIGRFVSTALMTRVAPARLLVIYAIINVVLCGFIMTGASHLVTYSAIAVFFFMSMMFPTIFAMGVKNLGSQTKVGSSFMIMAIVGGAIMPYFMGKLGDIFHISTSYILPLLCFAIVCAYAYSYPKLVRKPADPSALA